MVHHTHLLARASSLVCLLVALCESLHAQVGKVGINTTAPAAVLHVADSSVLFSVPNPLPAMPGQTPVSGAGNRFMWYADKAALRAGSVNGPQWDRDSIGLYSTVIGGINSQAKGLRAFIGGGNEHHAWGQNSFIGGGAGSLAQGANTFVGGGQFGNAVGQWSFVAGGQYGQTFSQSAFVGGGNNVTVSGNNAASAGGQSNQVGGPSSFIGGGVNNETLGWYSFIGGGIENTAPSMAEVAIGMYPMPYTAESVNSFAPFDRLFVVGNGMSNAMPGNALTILKNARTGIGTHQPAARLHVQDSSVLFSAPTTLPGMPSPLPASGPGTRMLWYPDKAAFRAGKVSGTQWNQSNIGNWSVAFGENTISSGTRAASFGNTAIASGNASFAAGENSTASGNFSVAFGQGNLASGARSAVFGANSTASGSWSSVMGYGTTASGAASFASGQDNQASQDYAFIGGGLDNAASGRNAFIGGGEGVFAKSYGEAVVGTFNTNYTPTSSVSWSANDRVFVVGNGTSPSQRSNAITVLKIGNTGIGTDTPEERLHVEGTIEVDYKIQANDADGLELATDEGTTRVKVADNGNVGIGTTSPLFPLHVGNGTQSPLNGSNTRLVVTDDDNGQRSAMIGLAKTTSGAKVEAQIEANGSNTSGPSVILGAASSHPLYLRTGNLTRVTIDDAGDVGIGTTSPSFQLHVSTNSAAKPTTNTWTVISDGRLKRNVQNYTDGLAELMQVRPVWFTYTGEAGLPKDTGVGVIAQELQDVAPYMVGTWTHESGGQKTDYLSVDNGAMTYMLINAVKEQQAIIDDQADRIAGLEAALADIRALLTNESLKTSQAVASPK